MHSILRNASSHCKEEYFQNTAYDITLFQDETTAVRGLCTWQVERSVWDKLLLTGTKITLCCSFIYLLKIKPIPIVTNRKILLLRRKQKP